MTIIWEQALGRMGHDCSDVTFAKAVTIGQGTPARSKPLLLSITQVF